MYQYHLMRAIFLNFYYCQEFNIENNEKMIQPSLQLLLFIFKVE